MLLEQIELLAEHADLVYLNLLSVIALGSITGGISLWLKTA
jgi:hypothetical protein